MFDDGHLCCPPCCRWPSRSPLPLTPPSTCAARWLPSRSPTSQAWAGPQWRWTSLSMLGSQAMSRGSWCTAQASSRDWEHSGRCDRGVFVFMCVCCVCASAMSGGASMLTGCRAAPYGRAATQGYGSPCGRCATGFPYVRACLAQYAAHCGEWGVGQLDGVHVAARGALTEDGN